MYADVEAIGQGRSTADGCVDRLAATKHETTLLGSDLARGTVEVTTSLDSRVVDQRQIALEGKAVGKVLLDCRNTRYEEGEKLVSVGDCTDIHQVKTDVDRKRDVNVSGDRA